MIELLEGKHALQLPVLVLVNNQHVADAGVDFGLYVNKILKYDITTLYLRAPGTLSDAFKLNVFETLLGQSVDLPLNTGSIVKCASESVSQFYISELHIPSVL